MAESHGGHQTRQDERLRRTGGAGPGCQSCCGRQGEADDTHVTPPIQCAPTAMMPARRCDHADAGGEPGRIRRHPYDAAHVVRADRDDAAREPG